MARILIEGNHKLSGTIRISGAKNAAVAIIPAAILSDDEVIITNIPNISDIDSLIDILEYLHIDVVREQDILKLNMKNMINAKIEENKSKRLRASYYFMGSLLGKYGEVEMYFPGGCNIGKRPINLHLNGFQKLGADITENNNKFLIKTSKLTGDRIYLDFPSVGATINIILAATKACGTTIIENAAREPEIVNVVTLLNSMGAKITGAGTSVIKIVGVKRLGKGFVEIIPDRIEAGTYAIIGSLLGENYRLEGIIPTHLQALFEKLTVIGVNVEIGEDYALFNPSSKLLSTAIKTQGYPGFPTDLQQPISVLLTQCEGISKIEETIYENRFMHVKYLTKMGAKIHIKKQTAIINGSTKLKGKEVQATDLRAGASLVIAGLIASGETIITDVEHILRGYDKIVEKLTKMGAKIKNI